jgi:prepilin-type N-terminal cleavage/methylation domain-containing protein
MQGMMMKRLQSSRGFSVVEMLVTIAIFGVLMGTAIPSLNPKRQDINTAMTTLMGDFRYTRAKAITTGTHFSVKMASTTRYQVQRHREDAGAWPVDIVTQTVNLPSNITYFMFPDKFEFNTRGMLISTLSGQPEPLYVYVYESSSGTLRSFAVWPSGQVNEEI